jgi:hypothetical protein
LMLTKKGDRRTKPPRPPVRPPHRLIISAQHILKYLESCPIIALVGGLAAKAGRAGRRKSASGSLFCREAPECAIDGEALGPRWSIQGA